MDFLNHRISHLSVLLVALVLFIICQTSSARSISYYQQRSENPIEISSDSYFSNQQQQQPEQEERHLQNSQESSDHLRLQKRRLVVRVPFAQSPDQIQLHRLYKTLFNTKQKKFMALQALL